MSSRKRETTEVRQQQIYEAAMRIIGERGIHGATTAGIAMEVGISEGNIYRHFTNKEEIVRAVIGKIGEDLSLILDSAKDIANPVEKLGTIFRRHLDYAENNRGVPRTVFSEEVMVDNGALRDEVKMRLTDYFDSVRETIAEGQRRGCIRRSLEPTALATMFIGTINFTIIRWVLSGFLMDMGKEGVVLWDNFARALSAVEETG